MKLKLLLLTLLSIFVAGIAAPAARALPATGSWYQARTGDQSPLVFAHQAGEGEYPSNSMIGFTAAHNAGADVLDTDMLVTSDGELVLYHDETLDFRTDCTGAVSAKTWAQLQQCDAAYDWTQDNGATYPYRGTGVKVIKASDLLTQFPNDRIGIEIKQVSPTNATALCTLITNQNATGRVLVSSGESGTQPNMTAFRTACPTVDTSATGGETVAFLQYFINNNFPANFNPPYSSIQPPMSLINVAFVAKAHQYQLKVFPRTIDTPAQALPLMDAGVDGLNTSYPQRILNWMASSPLKYCADGEQTYKLTSPTMSHGCVWVVKAWLNEARVKYGQTNNPSWPQLNGYPMEFDTQTKDVVIVWQYIAAGALTVNGEANPATINSMNTACLAAETQYSYNSALC